MKLTQSQIIKIQQTCDSYCKKLLKNKAKNLFRDFLRANRGRNDKNIEIIYYLGDDYSEDHGSYHVDDYPCEFVEFYAKGYKISIRDIHLSMAISQLTEKDRNIILLHYIMELSEREISKVVELAPSTINRRKKIALRFLEEYMKGNNEDEGKD